MKFFVLLLAFLPAAFLPTVALAQVSVTLQVADQAMIPGSVRTVYAGVYGDDNMQVRWTATGGCTLAHATSSATPQVVTAPAQGGICKLSNAKFDNEHPSFSSPVMCVVTATSVVDQGKHASIAIPVCAPQVQLATFPESTVLYKNQFAVIQSDLRGSVDTGVQWAISLNPGGAGKLTGGATNRHAVFSASAAGAYVLTATSKADGKKTASSTIYVTENELPASTPDHTEPVDCATGPKGQDYTVGPTHQFHDLNGVPWHALKPGATVRIFNEDTTGHAPTTYHQHISIAAGGNAKKPIRICGVPDAHGVKPIIDGEDATSPRAGDSDWASGWLEDLGIIMVYDAAHKWDTGLPVQENVAIEGLHLRNATPAYKFHRQQDGTLRAFSEGASCIHVHTGRGVLVRGNELENCTQAVFSNSQQPEASVIYDLTVEGNYIHRWGLANVYLDHAMYLQAMGLTVQFNYFDAASPGVIGNVVKTRSVLNFLRWNYITQSTISTARAFDMVEPQNYVCYVMPHSFAQYHQGTHKDCYSPHDGPATDPFPPDRVAANFEGYHSDYVYGNVLDDSGSDSAYVHYGYDQQTEDGPFFNRRGGTLYYWNNTHMEAKTRGFKLIFDPDAPDVGHSYEFPSIYSVNNVFGAAEETVFEWTRPFWIRVVVDTNWMKPGYILPNRGTVDSYQGGTSKSESESCGAYDRCHQGNGHMEWVRGGKPGTAAATLYTGSTPFAQRTFLPEGKLRGLAAALPAAIRDQPSNMEFHPNNGLIEPRKDLTVLGAME